MNELIGLLRTKLTIVDKTCESNGMAEIQKFYAETKYEGGRFQVPPFQDVANALLRGISCKERGLNAEIGRIIAATQRPLEDEDFEEAKRLIEGLFDEQHYRGRLNGFVDEVKSKASSYGISFDPASSRVDLAEAAYEAGMQNLLRQARSSVTSELALYRQHAETQPIRSNSAIPVLKAFWLANWRWIIGTVIAVASIVVSL